MSNSPIAADKPPAQEIDYSGETLLTMPKTLHRKLAEAAEREGVDLNQYLVMVLSEQNAQKTTLNAIGSEIDDFQSKLDDINRQLNTEETSARSTSEDRLSEISARDQRARARRVTYNNRYVEDWESGLND
ncbi:MAG: toxin-antitoxin system HicB family antitoxin [Phormidesmis sp.]